MFLLFLLRWGSVRGQSWKCIISIIYVLFALRIIVFALFLIGSNNIVAYVLVSRHISNIMVCANKKWKVGHSSGSLKRIHYSKLYSLTPIFLFNVLTSLKGSHFCIFIWCLQQTYH